MSVTAPILQTAYPGTAYASSAFTATGGNNGTYTWTWAAASGSSLPANFSINGSTGVISSSNPTNSGSTSASYNVVVTATDSLGNAGTANVAITIESTLTITTGITLPTATVATPYSQTLAVSGGSGTISSWQLTAGSSSLAAVGLGFNTTTGVVSGTSPTAGTANFTVTATDSQGHVSASVSFTLSVNTALKINQTTLPAGNKGSVYSQTLTAAGGSGSSYTFSEITTTLSSYGLTLATAGTITGTPTQSGTVAFTAKVTDSSSNTATQTLSILVYAVLSLPASNSLPAGYTGVAYTGAITGTGGSGTPSISITSVLTANGTMATNISGNTINITGTPSVAQTESLGVTLTDTTTSNFITQTYSFVVSTPTAPSLPALTLPAATMSQAYNQTITATGGVGPAYTWLVNGTSGSVSIGNNLTASNTGTNVLTISGTPNATGTVTFTAQIKDTTTNLTSGTPTSYSVTVNSAGSQVSGVLNITNYCSNVGLTQPAFTLTINTSPSQQIQSSNGTYSFSSIPNATYTVTPSYAGPTGASSVFYPATANITVNNGNISVPTFSVSLGYTVSGTVSYSGSHTGPIYLNLINSYCGGNGGSGTAITTPGAYTIHGVAPGSYTLSAWIDPTDLGLGQGLQNTVDPTGTASVTVATANVSGANVLVANHDPSAVPTQTPQFKGGFGTHNGVLLAYSPAVNSNRIETATSYDVAWSTSSTLSSGVLASIAGTVNYKAIGEGTVWILNNGVTNATSFTDGTTYYFMARANNGAGHGAWVVNGGSAPTGITANPPTGAATISGNVIIPSVTINANAKLYVGFFSNTGGIFATPVSSPAVGNNNPFTVNVPTGTWQFFAILDQNNDGEIDTGDLSNTRSAQGGPPTITISGSGTQNVPLTNSSIIPVVQTRYYSAITTGGTYTDYSFNLGAGAGVKQPVSIELTGASNPNVLIPMDISNYCQNCGSAQFQIYQDIHSDTPAVGDTYTYSVLYSDGSIDNNVVATVTGWNNSATVVGPGAVATISSPTGTTGPSAGTRTQPTFTWTYPAGASTAGDNYYFSLCCYNNYDIWDIPGQNSNSNGFIYSQAPGGTISWNVDPSGSGSTPTLGSLTVGTQYTWGVTANDSNGNEATAVTYFVP